jgi:hypothetical protein
MKPRGVERSCWGVASVALALAVMGWHRAVPSASALDTRPLTSSPAVRAYAPDSLIGAASIITAADPFRATRKPPAVGYRPDLEGAAPPPPARPPRPSLVLRGIVGEAGAWAAVLEGVPGRSAGIVVRRGDVLGTKEQPLTVRSIGRDTVMVQGADTTWRLTVPRAW